jgi:protein-tyrosine phosphatase
MHVLFVCTGNTCRSPMAAALLAARLAEAGVESTVSSAGTLFDGRPATDHGIACMEERGLDTSSHRSRKITPAMVKEADLVVGLARSHVRDVVTLASETWPRAFTLKELVRRAEEHGARGDEALHSWLARLSAGRRLSDLLGDSPADDVADPIGGPKDEYDATAAELDDLTRRLAVLMVAGPCAGP